MVVYYCLYAVVYIYMFKAFRVIIYNLTVNSLSEIILLYIALHSPSTYNLYRDWEILI